MVVTVGFFDGVHLGHRRVLRSLCENGESAAVVTFWPHPRVVLQHDARDFVLLSSLEEKLSLIRSFGVEDIRCVDFTKGFASISATDFIRDYLIEKMHCTRLVLGYDNRLGSDGLSTSELALLGRSMGLEVTVVDPYVLDGVNVSSTRIRNAVLDGDVAYAAQMLGYRYSISGIVVPGNRLGRTIGFPTANMKPTFPLKVLPKNGVYATEITVGDRHFRGMTNIGVRPTLGAGNERIMETNIFDFDEDIYGMEIQVAFMARIRNEQCFDSLDDLKVQLATDKHRCYGCN